jgi:hypothetical protein
MPKMEIPSEVFEIGILDKEYHARLLANLEGFASMAGIPQEFIWAKMSEYCSPEEMSWVRRMRMGSDHGLCYRGQFPVPIEDKMMAMTGACLRNYIDARMMSVQEVLSQLKDGVMPHQPTVLLIPNFCLSHGAGGDIPTWQSSNLLGLLYSRLARNLKTVLYIDSEPGLAKNYGEPFLKHIRAHYTLI